MGAADLVLLRHVAASQGLMLESTAEGLMQPGGAHWGCPDKEPSVRLATIEAAGEFSGVKGAARIPFTGGLLVGIGESKADRLRDLLSLRDLHCRYGHIQEIIIQPFRAKGQTRMGGWEHAEVEEVLWSVAVARIVFGARMSIQSPPNLSRHPTSGEAVVGGVRGTRMRGWGMQRRGAAMERGDGMDCAWCMHEHPVATQPQVRLSEAPKNSSEAEELLWSVAMARIVFGVHMSIQSPANLSAGNLAQGALIAAGINDWGGISPVTVDWVNPEAPWPHIHELASVTAASGKVLVPRLPVYPSFLSLHNQDTWL
ncbi:unnamed protein product, partial [Closterium sp. Naga37s-1]